MPDAQISWLPKMAVSPTPGWWHGGPSTDSMLGGSLVVNEFPEKQLRGLETAGWSARSPFDGLPYPPLADSLLPVITLPLAGKSQNDAGWLGGLPPRQSESPFDGGVSVSGYSCTTIPQESLWSTVLFCTVLYDAPESSMPVPMGAAPAMPDPGTSGLLLSCTWLP